MRAEVGDEIRAEVGAEARAEVKVGKIENGGNNLGHLGL
jgi:hypothetical protein